MTQMSCCRIESKIPDLKKKIPDLIYKLDIEVYNNLNWKSFFIFAWENGVREKMEGLDLFLFHHGLVFCTSERISLRFMVWCSILVNGAPLGCLHGSRGLREDGSLSPLLFILRMEVLSRMLSWSVAGGHISGFKVGLVGMKLSWGYLICLLTT